MRSHVSPQWFKALLMLMCAVHRRMKEGWWQGTKIMMCVRFPCSSLTRTRATIIITRVSFLLIKMSFIQSRRPQLPALESAKTANTAGFLFRSVNIDTVTSAASSGRMEAASYLVFFFAFHSPCCWPGVCREKLHHFSLLPATLTLAGALTHTLPFLSSPSAEADTTLTIIYNI